jgi:spore maturation protein CgeB
MKKKYKNIVVIGPYHPDSFAKCVTLTLSDMGYNTNCVDLRSVLGVSYEKGIKKSGNARKFARVGLRIAEIAMQMHPFFEKVVYKKVEKGVISYNPDLVVVLNGRVPPDTICSIKKKTKASVVLWFPDHPANLGRQYLFGAPYDALFFKDKFLVDMASRIGKRAFYLPECCMPEWHKKISLEKEEVIKYECDITIAGNLYHYRARIFEALQNKGYNIKIWGPPVPRWLETSLTKVHQGRVVVEYEKAKAFAGARIVVNTFQGEVDGVNIRTFEVAGCGAFQICEHRDALGDLFEIDKEIVTFKNIDDLVEKIEHYLKNPDKRKKIADAGQRRVYRDHTYKKRLSFLLETL